MRQIPSGIHSRLLRGAIKCSREDSLPIAGGMPSKVSLLLPRNSLFSFTHLQILGCSEDNMNDHSEVNVVLMYVLLC